MAVVANQQDQMLHKIALLEYRVKQLEEQLALVRQAYAVQQIPTSLRGLP